MKPILIFLTFPITIVTASCFISNQCFYHLITSYVMKDGFKVDGFSGDVI
ncbi:MAG: hypothetical protein IPK10_18640 [Bacteroidetes bacterium]|nr:hypothetical protein [Bacteroidota bacterium]